MDVGKIESAVSPKRPESALVVVYTKTRLVLLLQRADDPEFWQSVTGSLEFGEKPAAAAQRELAEETGLKVPVIDCHRSASFEIRKRWQHRYPAGTSHNREHVFLAELESETEVVLEPTEHLTYEWVSIADALRRLWSPTNRQAIEIDVLPRFE